MGLFGKTYPQEEKGSILIRGEKLSYTLIRSKRRSLSIQIAHKGGIILRAPIRMSKVEIERLLLTKSGWIAHKLAFVREQHRQVQEMPPSWPVLGNLLLIESSTSSRVKIEGDVLRYPKSWEEGELQDRLQSWNDVRARTLFPERFEEIFLRCCVIEPRLTRFDTDFRMRRMKRSWGNCRGTRITLNTELYKYPLELTDYVICHEISHLIHKDHGRGFYALQEQLYPNWKEARESLKKLSMQYARISQSSQPKVV